MILLLKNSFRVPNLINPFDVVFDTAGILLRVTRVYSHPVPLDKSYLCE